MSAKLAKKLGLQIHSSSFKSVRTASDRDDSVSGAVTFVIRFGRAEFQITAHILPSFLDSVDIIIGEDFMTRHSCVL